MVLKKKKLKIHSENILPIIKKWLYSEKDIFARELVSNACDALAKFKHLRDQGEAEAGEEELRIDITIDKDQRTLTFADTGLGMDGDEVEKYIAQIAFSGAEEFVEKYKSAEEGDQIIGHFGLGFYSAYMVADRVEIQTRSYRSDAKPAHWNCDGSSDYELDEGSREQRGTEVVLHISEAEEEYLDVDRIRGILSHYCTFLPHPIYINGEQLNEAEPLWIKPASECTDEDYLAFYHQLYPMQEDPLFWVHLNVDYPFNLKGILYFPKVQRDFDFNTNTIKLYCNRVFVSDNCKDLIPEYLMVLRGALDAPNIPLNVSRSYLQMDRTVRQLATHISKKVSDRLVTLFKTDREKFLTVWKNLETIVKLGALQDEKFYERVKECIVWKNLDGEYTTIEDYIERNKEKHDGKVFYTGDERHQPHLLDLYREKGIEVLYTSTMLDTHMISLLERHHEGVKFQRADGAIDAAIEDADGNQEAAHLAEFVKKAIGDDQLQVETKSLASQTLPVMLIVDEDARRMHDFMMMTDPTGKMAMPQSHTLVVNTNSKLVAAIDRLHAKDADLASDLVLQVYDLAKLSQREMKPEAIDGFISKSNSLLEKLAAKLSEATPVHD